MRIAYCTNVRLPSERAHGHQVAQVTHALSILGHDVTVFAPFRRNVVGADFHAYYHVPHSIRIEYIGSFDPIAPWLLPGCIGLRWMNFSMRRGLRRLLRPSSFDIVYTRSPALLPALVSSGAPVILELHQIPRFGRRRFVSLCHETSLIVALTQAMASTLRDLGVDAEKIMVAGDAVDLRRFTALPTKQDAQKTLGVATSKVVLGYVGRLKTLGLEKGVDLLLQAVTKDPRFFALIVGGPDEDCTFYRQRAHEYGLTTANVFFTGEVPAELVPTAISACDIATMPFPDLPHYRHFMSPLKMFEYMASHRPILTSDLPTIRDVLSEETAWLHAPGDVDDFLRSAREIAGHPDRARERTESAYCLVQSHTWEMRMNRILERFSASSMQVCAFGS